MKALLYCTKGKPYLVEKEINYIDTKRKEVKYLVGNQYAFDNWINGTIPCECDFEVEEIVSHRSEYETKTLSEFGLCDQSCLTHQELFDYFKKRMTGSNYMHNGYAIHIKNLHIFDMPRKLNDYYKFVGIDKNINNYKTIEKAPQNMMYVYEYISEFGLSGTWNRYFNGCIIISIHPEYLCKILNGEKTIEVRKKVLKCMKKKVN